jgi:AraC family transcriptional regulator of adaptative response / DNA-3-methyladenine glycosylase II
VASERIASGALNGHTVAHLATELGVSERHLRRALEREVSVSPLELAQTHRLLLAKRLIVDTDLPMTRVAYASGFQSLRRFNAVFRAQYRMPPSALRRGRRARADGSLRLTLAYRPPALFSGLPREAGVSIGGHSGVVSVRNSAADAHLVVDIAESLLPVLMPLIAGLRRVFDLDAEPAVIDAHLRANGLAKLVERWPGIRVVGVFERLEGAHPDAFATTDPALVARAEQWRPWRAYAAQLFELRRRHSAPDVPPPPPGARVPPR